jgi:hypothetical protein
MSGMESDIARFTMKEGFHDWSSVAKKNNASEAENSTGERSGRGTGCFGKRRK